MGGATRAAGSQSFPGPQAYQVFSAILASVVESGFIARTPCVGVSLPRARRREMHFLSAAQVASLAEVIRPPYGTLVYLPHSSSPSVGR